MVRQFVVVFVALSASVPVVGQAARASEHDHLVAKHAAAHGVPESLVRRVIQIESKGNPRVVSSGNYGLMQIRLGTARAMGYRGDAGGLLDADTNMTYAVELSRRRLPRRRRQSGAGDPELSARLLRQRQGAGLLALCRGVACSRRRPLRIRPCCGSRRSLSAATQRSSSGWSATRCSMRASAQQKAAEQTRIAERQAMLQARAEQQKAAEQARAAQRQAMAQERIDRQHALQQQIVEQRNAAEQKRAEQRQAVLQQRIDREQAQQQQRIGREQARQTAASAVPAEPPRIAPQAQPSARRSQPRRSARPPGGLRLVQSDALLQASVAPVAPAAARSLGDLFVGLYRVAQQFARRLGAVERAQRAALDLPARRACAPDPSGWRRRGGCESPC